MKIKFIGAARTVTGSKHLITTRNGKTILLDCGLFQGEDAKVEEIVEKIKEGPPVSRVDDVELYWQNIKEVFEGFEIRK